MATDDEVAVLAVDFVERAQLAEKAGGRLNALGQRPPQARPVCRQSATDAAHHVIQL